MATWDELRSYIEGRYRIAHVTEYGQLMMMFDLPNGRSQSVMVARAVDGSNGREWAKIESVVGRVGEVDLARLLEIIRFQLVGGLAKNDDFVTVRHSIPLWDMSADEFEEPLAAVLESADHLESASSRVDRY